MQDNAMLEITSAQMKCRCGLLRMFTKHKKYVEDEMLPYLTNP
jgi:hypothetical protein